MAYKIKKMYLLTLPNLILVTSLDIFKYSFDYANRSVIFKGLNNKHMSYNTKKTVLACKNNHCYISTDGIVSSMSKAIRLYPFI